MAEGLDGRHRDADGQIDKKRDDTLIGSLRGTYGQGIAPGLPDSATLGRWRAQNGGLSLSQLLQGRGK
jgi:hypothetical protein